MLVWTAQAIPVAAGLANRQWIRLSRNLSCWSSSRSNVDECEYVPVLHDRMQKGRVREIAKIQSAMNSADDQAELVTEPEKSLNTASNVGSEQLQVDRNQKVKETSKSLNV